MTTREDIELMESLAGKPEMVLPKTYEELTPKNPPEKKPIYTEGVGMVPQKAPPTLTAEDQLLWLGLPDADKVTLAGIKDSAALKRAFDEAYSRYQGGYLQRMSR